MDLADGAGHFVARHVLEEIAAGPRFERPLDVHIAVPGGQRDDPCLGELGPDDSNGLDSVHDRHTEVHQCDVGLVLPPRFDRFAPIGGLGHQGEVGIGRDERGQATPVDGMVIHGNQ